MRPKLTKDKRKEAAEAIAEWVKQGEPGQLKTLRDAFPAVPRATFFRMVAAARESPAVIGAIRETARQVTKSKPAEKATPAEKAAASVMPAGVHTDHLGGGGAGSATEIVERAMKHIERVIGHCYAEDGRIRNPKLLLAAADRLNRSVDVLARVAERLNDAQKIEAMNAAIFEEIRKADPETGRLIVERIHALRQSWGLTSGG